MQGQVVPIVSVRMLIAWPKGEAKDHFARILELMGDGQFALELKYPNQQDGELDWYLVTLTPVSVDDTAKMNTFTHELKALVPEWNEPVIHFANGESGRFWATKGERHDAQVGYLADQHLAMVTDTVHCL